MKKIKFYKWDTAEYLKSENDIKRYLEAVFNDGDPNLISEALGNIARARKMMGSIAKEAKVNNKSIYRSLSTKGTPYFRTINTAVHSLGYQLTIAPLKQSAA